MTLDDDSVSASAAPIADWRWPFPLLLDGDERLRWRAGSLDPECNAPEWDS